MARIVETSDDDLPDIVTLMKGAGRSQRSRSVGVPDLKENKSNRAQQRSDGLDESSTAPKSAIRKDQDAEEKKKPRKRILNNQNDNPLLKPLSANASSNKLPVSPAKRSVKSRKLQSDEERSTQNSTESIIILDSDSEVEFSKEISTRNHEKPSKKVIREKKITAKRNLFSKGLEDDEVPGLGSFGNGLNVASRLTPGNMTRTAKREWNSKFNTKSSAGFHNVASKQPPNEDLVVETMQIAERFDNNPLDVPNARKGPETSSEKVKNLKDSVSDSEDLSDFIVRDSISPDEEDSILAIPPPRSVRRLVKGRRPRRVDESDEKSLFKSSDSEGLAQTSINVKMPREVATKALKCSEKALVLDFEGLSLGDK